MEKYKELFSLIKSKPNILNEKYVNKHYPIFNMDLNKYLIDNSIDINIPFKEKYYIFSNNIMKLPNCYCGGKVSLNNIILGYRAYCSVKCMSNSDEITMKRKETNIVKYGVDNPMKSKEVRDNLSNTLLDKYGVDNISKLDEIKEMKKETSLRNYGETHYFKTDFMRDKLSKRGIERSNELSKLSTDRSIDYNIEKLSKFNIEFIGKIGYEYKCLCDLGHEFMINRTTLNSRIELDKTICVECNGIKSFTSGCREIGKILEDNNINYRINKRILDGKEIDILVDSLNIGFEYNGYYWHSDEFKEKDYHILKTNEATRQNIKLYHVWEDEWIENKEYLSNKIKYLLGLFKSVNISECTSHINGRSQVFRFDSIDVLKLTLINGLLDIETFEYQINFDKNIDLQYNLVLSIDRFDNKEILKSFGYKIVENVDILKCSYNNNVIFKESIFKIVKP